MKPILSPQQIQTFPLPQSILNGNSSDRIQVEMAAKTVYFSRGVLPVSFVSCGSGFTVCVMRDSGASV